MTLTFLGVAALGVLATVLAVDRAISQRTTEDHRAAAAAADALRAELTATTSSFAGGDVLAIDGEVSPQEFAAFGGDILEVSGLEAVAYSQLVSAASREEWQRRSGHIITDLDREHGGFRPAGTRDGYVAVTYAVPLNDLTTPLLGLDLLSDPVRAAAITAADASETTVVVGPIQLASSERPGVFVARAIRDPNGTTVGYVSSGIGLDEPLARIQETLGIEDLSVALDDATVSATGSGTSAASFELNGRTFVITARSDRGPNWLLPIALGLGTVALCVSAVVAAQRDHAERRRVDRSHDRAVRLRELAEGLAGTTSTMGVMRHVADHAGPALGAAHTRVGRPSSTDLSKLEVIHDVAMVSQLDDVVALVDLDAELPLAECARTGAVVCVTSRDELRARYPQAMADLALAGSEALLCVPLSLGDDRSVGVVGFAFDRELEPGELVELETAANLVSQMTGRAFERALVREIVEERVRYLGDFTHALTSANSVEEVEAAVAQLLPPVLDLHRALVVAPGTGLGSERKVRSYPLHTADRVALQLALPKGRRWTPTDEGLAVTLTDLVQAALARARLHDEQHDVLLRFQQTLLSPPAPIEGFDIAVGYHPALDAIGMGGDWYSVIDTPDRLYAVVGDVAGHGASAIAIMAEVKSILRHLLGIGTPIDDALDQADRALRRRDTYASAVIVEIDKHSPTIRYVNAGHPPTLLLSADGIARLNQLHRPLLGVVHPGIAPPSIVVLADGDVLVLYTDGLIEERGQVIDVGIDELAGSIDREESAASIIESVLAHRISHRTVRSVDDDIAVIALKRGST